MALVATLKGLVVLHLSEEVGEDGSETYCLTEFWESEEDWAAYMALPARAPNGNW